MPEEYWTISSGIACRNGWSCRECKAAIWKGDPMVCRDGRKLRLMYHPDCFSGESDVRSQPVNKAVMRKYAISEKAPEVKGAGKWSTTYGVSGASLVSTRSSTLELAALQHRLELRNSK